MTTKKVERRIKIKFRIRKSVNGTAERPRLSVFRSNKQIYAQVINDLTGTTLASASSLGLEKMPKQEQATKVGELIAEKAKAAGVEVESVTLPEMERLTKKKQTAGYRRWMNTVSATCAKGPHAIKCIP